jgi:peptidoglycan/LPS O-acetylase OafA/YrhL
MPNCTESVNFPCCVELFRMAGEPPLGSGTQGRPRAWAVTTSEILGQWSSPTYLFHGPFLMLISSVIVRWDLITDWRITWAILFLTGTSSGVALGYLLERPILGWRKSFLQRFETPRPSTVGGGARVRIAGAQD